MIRAVLDTNVLISGLVSQQGPAAEVLRLADDGLFELFVWRRLRQEFREKLRTSKSLRRYVFNRGLDPKELLAAGELVFQAYPLVKLRRIPKRLHPKDPKDVHVVAGAIAAHANYLVSQDKRDLLVMGDLHATVDRTREIVIRTVSPPDFLAVVRAAATEI